MAVQERGKHGGETEGPHCGVQGPGGVGGKTDILPRLAPLTGRARAILDQLAAIKNTIEAADKVAMAGLLDSFIERVEPIFDVKEVGKSKKRRTEVVGFRFIPKEAAKNVLSGAMEIGVSRTAVSFFHFLASAFLLEIRYSDPTPTGDILRLRATGGSLAAVAEATGTTVAKVRRLVPRVDKVAHRRQQEEKAKTIDALPLTWTEKAERWTAETGTSGTTFWRVCERVKRAEVRKSPPFDSTSPI